MNKFIEMTCRLIEQVQRINIGKNISVKQICCIIRTINFKYDSHIVYCMYTVFKINGSYNATYLLYKIILSNIYS